MLNAKYFYFGSNRNNVIVNNYANGNSWLVSDVHMVNSADEEIYQLDSIVTKTRAIMDGTLFSPEHTSFNNKGTINLSSYAPNKMVYTSNTEGASLAIFSEIFYPKGWSATIDGKEANILRANYVLRALEIPPGNHTIEFKFEPAAYVVGNKITAVFSILVILVLAVSIYFELKGAVKMVEENE